MTRYLLTLLAITLFVNLAKAAPPPSRTLEDAATILDDLAAIPLKNIPTKLLADAHGVAIIPRVVKAGFVLAGRGGHGVVLAKDKDGNWTDPVFINLGGGSVGFQAGVESTDVVLIFRTRKSLDRLLDGKNKLTLGADASVAAGPIGRQAQAATDGKLEAEIVSYSRSRGLFAGVSLDGTVLNADARTNETYRRDPAAEDKKLAALKGKLIEMSSGKDAAEKPGSKLAPPVVVPSAPPVKSLNALTSRVALAAVRT